LIKNGTNYKKLEKLSLVKSLDRGLNQNGQIKNGQFLARNGYKIVKNY